MSLYLCEYKKKGCMHFNAHMKLLFMWGEIAQPAGLTPLIRSFLSCFYVYQRWESQLPHMIEGKCNHTVNVLLDKDLPQAVQNLFAKPLTK